LDEAVEEGIITQDVADEAKKRASNAEEFKPDTLITLRIFFFPPVRM
jgi:hypothetical protein